MYIDRVLLLRVTTVLRTVTLQVAVALPSADVAIIVADPAFTAVTEPLLSTVTTAGLLDFQVTFWVGLTVAVKFATVPIYTDKVELLRVTAVLITVTLQDVVDLPSAVVAVIVAVPTFTPASVPLDTFTMEGLLDFQVTAWDGFVLAIRELVDPKPIVKVELLSAMGAGMATVTVQEEAAVPS